MQVATKKPTTPTSRVSLKSAQMVYSAMFANIRIEVYDNSDDPLFKASQIGEVLGMKDIPQDFEAETDYCHRSVSGEDAVMVTDIGFYKMVSMSERKDIRGLFQQWVRGAIKQIRQGELEKIQYDVERGLVKTEQQRLLDENERQEERIAVKRKEERDYDEVEKTETVYIVTTDKEDTLKIGRTTKTTIAKRLKTLQTACVDDIFVVAEFATSNSALVESVVHYLLHAYRKKSNREHFDVDPVFAAFVIEIVCHTIHTLVSANHSIDMEELKQRMLLGNKGTRPLPSKPALPSTQATMETALLTSNESPVLVWFNNETTSDAESRFHLAEAFPHFCKWYNKTYGITYNGR